MIRFFTRPMHAAEVASVLLNFFSNSLKALRRIEGQRRILVKAEREGEDQIIIRFLRTPAMAFWTRIARRFSTSSSRPGSPRRPRQGAAEQYSGTGLGLWIVHQIISKAGGDVEVVDAQDGFSTCFKVRLPAEEED